MEICTKPNFFFLLLFIFCSPIVAQTTIKRLSGCIDEAKTVAKSEFPCANTASVLTPTNVVAVKRLANGALQMQFAQKGEVSVSCNCANGSTEIIKIDVVNCDTPKCMGENLVPNSSFENFANCLSAPSRLTSLTNVVLPWFDFTGGTSASSDYFNPDCPYNSPTAFGIPILKANRARTGSGFIGEYCYTFPPVSREYVAVPLTTPLSIGKRYRARFYTKISPPITTTYARIDRVAMSLMTTNPRSTIRTTTTPYGITNDYVGNQPIVISPSGVPAGDTTFWTRYETIFRADSAYTFLMLGGLAKFTDMHTYGNSAVGYYFFDDVSIHELDLPPDTTRISDSLTCFVKDTGLIQRKLINRYGCDSLVLQKVVLANPIFISLGNDTVALNGSRFTFKPLISGDSMATITWLPTSGLSCNNCLTPQYIAHSKTEYVAKVVGRKGCSASDTLQIDIKEQPFVYVPTAFSPNGDNINDVLTVYGSTERVKSILRFTVYNRWGGVVFESRNFAVNDEASGWRGNDLSSEVYVYLVEIELLDGQKVVIGGDTTLMR